MAVTLGKIFINPDAIKGYLECRKLLVERETWLVQMKVEGPKHAVITMAKDIDFVPTRNKLDEELAIVRAQIAEIDATIKGGQ